MDEMIYVMSKILDRIEAWQEGERIAQRSAEERGDADGASAHDNAAKNYAALSWMGRAAIARARK